MKAGIIFSVLLLLATAYAQDFRNVSWNMNFETVKELEKEEQRPSTEHNDLEYNVKINNYEMILQYIFEENKLVAASYFKFIESRNYLQFYRYQKNFFLAMKEILDVKYGSPVNINQSTDIMFFYDIEQKMMKKYVNYNLSSFLDRNETNNQIQYKAEIEYLFDIGYIYLLKYETDKTVIMLIVSYSDGNIQQEIAYIEKNNYLSLNENIRKNMVSSSGL